MSAFLAAANVLIALLVPTHEHHDAAERWMMALTDDDSVASDPVTEGAFVRYAVRVGYPAGHAQRILEHVHSVKRWEFWDRGMSYADVDLRAVRGHRQVTDAYLVSLARSHGGILTTFDQPLAARFPTDVVRID